MEVYIACFPAISSLVFNVDGNRALNTTKFFQNGAQPIR